MRTRLQKRDMWSRLLRTRGVAASGVAAAASAAVCYSSFAVPALALAEEQDPQFLRDAKAGVPVLTKSWTYYSGQGRPNLSFSMRIADLLQFLSRCLRIFYISSCACFVDI
jgi:hypothetical protein